MSIEVPELPAQLAVIEHSYSEATDVSSPALSTLITGQHDRVFHSVAQAASPRQTQSTQRALIEGEVTELFVTLQNPFPFELLLESLQIRLVKCVADIALARG